MSKVDELLESISGLTLVEAYDLVKAIEEKFEVSAAAPVAAAAAETPSSDSSAFTSCESSMTLMPLM